MKREEKILIGWEEWCELPELGLPAIKAKIDTGARTSALHAFNIEEYHVHGQLFVKFQIHPLQRNFILTKNCVAKVIDKRYITSSSGHRELRYVIKTPLTLGNHTWPIEITLSNRDPLIFRMLLGRASLRGKVIIDPIKSHITKRIRVGEMREMYKHN